MLRRSKGFTIIELLVVVAVMAIILAIVIPNVTRFLPTQRLSSGVGQVLGDLRLARQKAIAEGNDMVFKCHSDSTCYYVHDNDDSDRGVDYDEDAGEKVTLLRLPGLVRFRDSHTFAFKSDGTAIDPVANPPVPISALSVVLYNRRGERDSLSVLPSGMVMK